MVPTGPNSFSVPIGKEVDSYMPDLAVVNFVSIGNRNFPEIPDEVVQD